MKRVGIEAGVSARSTRMTRPRRLVTPEWDESEGHRTTIGREVGGVHARVRESLSMLPPGEEEMIRMRFGIDQSRTHTRHEVSERLRIPLSTLARMEARVLQRLRWDGPSQS